MKIVASDNKAEIFLYGYIGYDISAQEFMTALREHEGMHREIVLLINSGGGEMFEGLPLYNNICLSPVNITADIQGLAASMITIVMCAAKKVRAASNAKIMVHGPRGGDYTNIEGLENLVDLMKDMRDDMAKVYAKKTGKTEQWIIDNWLSDGKDHWFSAQEAKVAGLVDEVYEVQVDSMPQASWPLRRIAAFYDEKLSLNPIIKNEPNMKKVITLLNATGLAGQLPETATEELVAAGVQAITGALSAKDQTIASLKKKIGEMEMELSNTKVTVLKDKATALVENALSAKKIIAEQKEPYITLASASEAGYDQVKKLLDQAKPHMSVTSQLKVGETTPETTPTALKAEFKKRANAKDGEPTLEDLKAENLEHFKLVYEAGTGKPYKA